MSTWREIVIEDRDGNTLTVGVNGDGVIKAETSTTEPVELDESDRKDLRDFLTSVA